MFSQFTPRISRFSRALHMFDVSHDFVAAPPVPSTNETHGFDSVNLLNSELTPGPSASVDAIGEDADDVHFEFPPLYLPTYEEAASEPQSTQDMLEADTSGDISGLFFLPDNFGFPAIPTDWDSTSFNHNSIVDEYPVFQATQPVPNDGSTFDLQTFLENGFSIQPFPGMDLKDFGSSPEQLMNMPEQFTPHIESFASSINTTPESITPPDFDSLPFLRPAQEQSSSSTLWDPQPCLAVPTSYEEITTAIQASVSPVEEKGTSVLPGFDYTKVESSTSNSSSSGAGSPSPTLPPDFFIQNPSSTGARRSSRKKTRATASRTAEARRSGKGKNKDLSCTYDDCLETFCNDHVLRRHLQTVHQNTRWYCPGSCGKAYTRNDALNRHLNSVDEQSSCQIAARALGWHPHEKCSVRKLRVASA